MHPIKNSKFTDLVYFANWSVLYFKANMFEFAYGNQIKIVLSKRR